MMASTSGVWRYFIWPRLVSSDLSTGGDSTLSTWFTSSLHSFSAVSLSCGVTTFSSVFVLLHKANVYLKRKFVERKETVRDLLDVEHVLVFTEVEAECLQQRNIAAPLDCQLVQNQDDISWTEVLHNLGDSVLQLGDELRGELLVVVDQAREHFAIWDERMDRIKLKLIL